MRPLTASLMKPKAISQKGTSKMGSTRWIPFYEAVCDCSLWAVCFGIEWTNAQCGLIFCFGPCELLVGFKKTYR